MQRVAGLLTASFLTQFPLVRVHLLTPAPYGVEVVTADDKDEVPTSVPFALLSAAAALVAGLSIPGQRPGVNLAVTGILVLSAVGVATRRGIDRSYGAFIVLALALLSLPAVRSAAWLVPLDLLGVLLVVSVGVARARGWAEISMSVPRVVRNLPRGTLFVLAAFPRRATFHVPDIGLAMRASVLSGVLLLTFGALFVSADPAFASLAEQFLVPDWDLTLVPLRVIVSVGGLALTGSIALLSPELGDRSRPTQLGGLGGNTRIQLGAGEWKSALLLIDLLFISFVVVQVAVLFGGHDHVLKTAGLTYAEYARQGFLQLIVVALLTLAVVAAAVRLGRVGVSDLGWMKILLGLLCLLTLVILASALTRMNLYQEAYGFTRLRLLVDLAILWLGAVFLMLLVAGVKWQGNWLPRAIVLLSAAALIGFNAYNPDARIAEQNIERYLRTGKLDVPYLASLSADAAPQLIRLPEPLRSCALANMRTGLGNESSFWSWNLARENARRLLEPPSFHPQAQQDDCRF
jgi:hypothetical protein